MSMQWDIGKPRVAVEYGDFKAALIAASDALRYITGEKFNLSVQFYGSTVHTCTSAIDPDSARLLEKENAARMSGQVSEIYDMRKRSWARAAYVTADLRPSNYGPANSWGPIVQIEAKGRILNKMNFYARAEDGGIIEEMVRHAVCKAMPSWRVGDGRRSHHYASVKCL